MEHRNKKKKTIQTILIVLVAIIVSGVIGAFTFVNAQMNKLNNDTVNTINRANPLKEEKEDFCIDQNAAANLKYYTNIALLGVDARKGENIEDCRTDAIVIVSIHKETGSITLTSVARDSFLLMNDKNENLMLDKATHAHAFGGPVNTVRMLNKSLDLNIENYAVLNWNSIVDLVDAVGGITVDVKDNEIRDLNKWGPETAKNTDKEWTPITETGEQEFDGAQAATYCRIRKTSGGDNGRTERMKQVASAVFEKVKKDPTLVTKVTDVVFPQVTTNMTTSDLLPLVRNVLDFEIKDTVSYPYNYWGGIVDGKWIAVPTTLEENNKRLHAEVFGNDFYIGSDSVKEINDKIINETGISVGSENE